MVVLFLLPSSFPLQPMHCVMLPDPVELLLFPFLLGSLFLSFLSPYLFKGGSGSLLLFFMGCHLESYITLCQFRGRDNSPPGWPGGSLRVGNCRALAVQLHHDGWGKTRFGMSACLSSTLFWPPDRWQGDGSSPAST